MTVSTQTTPIIAQLVRGDTLELPVTFTQAGEPVSIVGWTLSFTAKTSPEDTDDDAQVQFDYIFPDDDGTQAGTATVLIPASTMQTLIPGKVYIDLQIEIPAEPESIIKTFSLGRIPVLADITQRIP
jgi:hypothetical protein